MSEADNAKDWIWFEDHQTFDQFQNTGIIELKRKYYWNNRDGENYHPDLDRIVAKGISAFLAFTNRQSHDSLRLLLKGGYTVDMDEIFSRYFNRCFELLSIPEKRKPFKEDRKSDYKLIQEHLKSEIENLKGSNLLFTELNVFSEDTAVNEREISLIADIKRAAECYPKWVREKLKKDSKPLDIENFEVDQKIEGILREIFPGIKDTELSDFKGNLKGIKKYVPLIFEGSKNTLERKLNLLKEIGIDRSLILNTVQDNVRWRKNVTNHYEKLIRDEWTHKV